MVLEIARSLFSWVFILPALFLIGHSFDRWIPIKETAFKGVIYCGIGMAILSYSILLLSLLNLLNRTAIWVLLVAILLVRVKSINELGDWIHSVGRHLVPKTNFSNFVLTFILTISLVGLLAGVFSPEIAGDSLCYQLNVPKIFLEKGSVTPLFYDLNSYFPMLMNYLYLIGLATGGVFSAKLFHLFSAVLLFIALKSAIELETKNHLISFFSALIVWLTPTFYNLASTTYVDIGLTLYSFLSLWTLVYAFREKLTASFFLSGIFLGCAAGTKYLVVLSIPSLVAVWVYEILARRDFRKNVQRFVLWSTGSLIGGGFWLLWNWIKLGNPLFPYMAFFFGTQPLPDQSFDLPGMGTDFLRFVAVIFNLFLHPKAFGQASESIGIIYGLFYPFVFLAPVVRKEVRGYFIFSFIFLVLWFIFGQATRYLMPLLPCLLLVGTVGLDWLLAKLKPMVIFFVSSIGVLFLCAYLAAGLFHYRYTYLLFLRIWTPFEYLLKMERTIPVAVWINQNLPKHAKILIENESRLFYIDRPVLRDIFFNYRTRYPEKAKDIASFYALLRSNNITHILTTDLLDQNTPEATKTILRALAESKYSRLIYKVASENIREDRFYYRLYELIQ